MLSRCAFDGFTMVKEPNPPTCSAASSTHAPSCHRTLPTVMPWLLAAVGMQEYRISTIHTKPECTGATCNANSKGP